MGAAEPKPPAVATVSLETLTRLHRALIGESSAPEIDALILELAHLIQVATEKAWPLCPCARGIAATARRANRQ